MDMVFSSLQRSMPKSGAPCSRMLTGCFPRATMKSTLTSTKRSVLHTLYYTIWNRYGHHEWRHAKPKLIRINVCVSAPELHVWQLQLWEEWGLHVCCPLLLCACMRSQRHPAKWLEKHGLQWVLEQFLAGHFNHLIWLREFSQCTIVKHEHNI